MRLEFQGSPSKPLSFPHGNVPAWLCSAGRRTSTISVCTHQAWLHFSSVSEYTLKSFWARVKLSGFQSSMLLKSEEVINSENNSFFCSSHPSNIKTRSVCRAEAFAAFTSEKLSDTETQVNASEITLNYSVVCVCIIYVPSLPPSLLPTSPTSTVFTSFWKPRSACCRQQNLFQLLRLMQDLQRLCDGTGCSLWAMLRNEGAG